MYQTLSLFGLRMDMYNTMFFLGLVSVVVLYFCLRKRFGYTGPRTAFYSLFTLVFGMLLLNG